MPFKLDENDGYLEVEVPAKDSGGEPQRVFLDLFESNNRWAQISEQHADAIEQGREWVAYLASKGVNVSSGAAFRLAAAVMREVGEYKKKHETEPSSATPDSPGSSASPSEKSAS